MSAIEKQSVKRFSQLDGFTLVEVLIALIIMSVGMLGIAGLYVHSMNAGRTSVFRHQAVSLAGDVADRIRANPLAGVNYQVVGVNNNCVDGGIDCNATQMAQNDILIWDLQAADSLPTGTVNIQFTDNPAPTPDTYVITIAWVEAGQTPPPQYAITIPVNDF